ncbi:MAG: glycosyltransferase family 2 protein [Acidimicrobiia bacterium]|nr:glycosyltransferase family 2 protein [Acidimicrobiia bacterium]
MTNAVTPFTLVVVVYHRSEPLRRLLGSALAGCTANRPRVIVVNLEDDPAVRAVAEEFDADIVTAPDQGYAAAVNRGAQEVTDAITIFSCDDLEVDMGSLRRLADTIASGAADVAAPRIVDLDGGDEATVRALPTPWRLLLEWAVTSDRPRPGAQRIQKWRRPTTTESVDAFDAALVAVRTQILRDVPLAEDYFLYWEEIDWCWRLRSAGYRSVLVPAAVVRHAGGRDDVRADKQRLLARNAVRCVARTQGRWAALTAWPIIVAWQLRLLVVDSLRATVGKSDRVPARAAGVVAAVGAWREIR